MKLLSKHGFNISIKDTYLETLLPRFKEERIGAFFTLALTLTTITIFGLFAINPTLTTIAQLRKQLEDNKFVDQKLREKIANLRTLQDNYTQIQENIPVVLDAIPTAPTIPLFTAYVQGAVTQSRVKLVILQTLPVEFTADAPPHAYMSFAFSLTAEGTTGNIDTFLTSLQSFARLVTIDEFSIRKTPDNLNLFQLTVKGKAYFKKV